PFLTPRLSSRWIGLVTPIPPALAKPLIESLVNDVVVTGRAAADAMPTEQITYREAVRLALGRSRAGKVPTSWAMAELGGRAPAAPQPTDPSWAGGTVLSDRRERASSASADAVWRTVCRIGGDTGWYAGGWMWWLRGVADSLMGGVGMRRGRLHPDRLSVGDPVDFWRVEALEPSQLVRLRAEMRLPGDAWLQWEISDDGAGGSTVVQTARFHPRGLLGRVYWLVVAPFHGFVFPGLVRGICRDAEAGSDATRDSAR
ncbi:MAG: SDR family oxidoreductase, partial [Actinobacteria bacterium]|nr:SDR family oxidoreductase [Actinomycetota bacterium]